MPHLIIDTNVPDDKIPASLPGELVDIVATSLGKPKNLVMVDVNGSRRMNYGGSDAPCALGTLVSIGALGPGPNKKASAGIMQRIQDTLGVPSERFYILFYSAKISDIGWRGSTFVDFPHLLHPKGSKKGSKKSSKKGT